MQHGEPVIGRVVVFGSANEDLVLPVATLPIAGATVLAGSSTTGPGGKGANQAVAAAREGADVAFIGAVGDDERGLRILDNLARQRVDVDGVRRLAEPTGLAVVVVAADGGNLIVVASGANGCLEPAMLDAAIDELRPADVAVIQCEIPTEVVAHLVRRIATRSARVILNLAPYVDLDRAVLALVDLLLVNEGEARSVLGGAEDLAAVDLAAAVRGVVGVDTVVTLGERGSVLAAADGTAHVPAVLVPNVVDTTGAGDVFAGTLAAALAGGASVRDAIERAGARAAESVTTRGAQAPADAAFQLN